MTTKTDTTPVWFGNDFFVYKNRLYAPSDYLKGLMKEKGIDYVLEQIGVDEVFYGVSDWDGDPWCETSEHAELDQELFDRFLLAVKETK